ncbi:RagB/SusD family nutrient uptake outer membrane protein [Sphingobacterium sp. InxBP1]|uniref:RagB/SusD family nutrient uptake outer membrane protein n=1 Tax=Sphingobacterium sp. InxBP1 TaxID=2870328 RepID=UPI002243BD50|nr:RagB/SusD family nutrient uptake outer membrane protein [Sphingobacterium sp. InxBP1]MCW8312984.1 RagB/SusD family nutrient uptake outer membrane protein [Sphingobacterium sp. InxBP1]
MKRINLLYKMVLLGIVLSAASCGKQLFEDPYAYLSPEQAFSTPDRIAKSATGLYDALQNREFLGGRALIYADIRGADCGTNIFFGNMPQFSTLLSTDATVGLAYQGAYRTINEANLFIENLSAKPGVVSAIEEAQYFGEAKFIRALSYFYLVNLWAQPYNFSSGATHAGVPLILKTTTTPFAEDNNVPRASVKQVYDQIESDLLAAEASLPVSGGAEFSTVARATKSAAQALLARVYLYEGNYAKAVEFANKVINSNIYSLNPSPLEAFRNTTTAESIFSVAHNGGDNPNTNHSLGQHYSPNLRADIQVLPTFVSLIGTTDKRRTELITEKNGAFFNLKYTSVSDWAPILRYSEVLLIKAEALANQASGVSAEALALVNVVRHRSAPTENIVATSKTALIEAIWKEKRIELAFEGHGIFEYLRTKRDVPSHGTISEQAYGSDFVVLPIPFDDMQKNSNLIQNPGY